MGCWNATCAVSQLPIKHGEKVKAYILIPHHFHDQATPAFPEEYDLFRGSGVSYPHDAYSPLFIPIDGEYNDYGSLENIKENLTTKSILEWVNKRVRNASDPNELPYNSFQEMIDGISQGDTCLGLTMINASIYDASIAGMEELHADCQYDSDKLTINLMQDFELAQEYLQTEGAKESLLEGLATLGIKSAIDQEPQNMKLFKAMHDTYPKREGAQSTIVDSFGSGFSNREGIVNTDFAREFFKKILKSQSAPIQGFVDHFLFCCFMNRARRTWITQAGNGSQSDDYKLYRFIAEATLAHIEEVKKEHAADVDLTIPEELEHFNKQY